VSFSNQEEEPSFSSVEAGGAFGFKGESEDALVFDTSSSFLLFRDSYAGGGVPAPSLSAAVSAFAAVVEGFAILILL
jgi:hypothetical protein